MAMDFSLLFVFEMRLLYFLHRNQSEISTTCFSRLFWRCSYFIFLHHKQSEIFNTCFSNLFVWMYCIGLCWWDRNCRDGGGGGSSVVFLLYVCVLSWPCICIFRFAMLVFLYSVSTSILTRLHISFVICLTLLTPIIDSTIAFPSMDSSNWLHRLM